MNTIIEENNKIVTNVHIYSLCDNAVQLLHAASTVQREEDKTKIMKNINYLALPVMTCLIAIAVDTTVVKASAPR